MTSALRVQSRLIWSCARTWDGQSRPVSDGKEGGGGVREGRALGHHAGSPLPLLSLRGKAVTGLLCCPGTPPARPAPPARTAPPARGHSDTADTEDWDHPPPTQAEEIIGRANISCCSAAPAHRHYSGGLVVSDAGPQVSPLPTLVLSTPGPLRWGVAGSPPSQEVPYGSYLSLHPLSHPSLAGWLRLLSSALRQHFVATFSVSSADGVSLLRPAATSPPSPPSPPSPTPQWLAPPAAAIMEAATRHTTTATDGVRLSYTLVGSGPTKVLCIPGMCTPGAMWAPQVAAFLAGGQVSMALVDNRTLQR